MAAMGPEGFAEVGRLIMARSSAAARLIDALDGASVDLSRPVFKEFVVTFERPVAEMNAALRARGLFGGKDITGEPGADGNAALFCVTEVHTDEDIDRLITTLKKTLA